MCAYVQWLELNFIRAWNASTVAMLLYCTLTCYPSNKDNGRLNMALNTPSAFPLRVIRITHPRYIHHSQLDPPLSFPLARRQWAPTTVATGLFLQPTLMHNSITKCISHYHPRHVSALDMPILRRNNCTNTASGILALISGCTLHRLRADWSVYRSVCDIHVVIELCIKVGWRNNPILWCTVEKTSKNIKVHLAE